MKRTLPFALATLGILALFAASPILPKLGVPLDVEKVVNAVFQDDAVEEVVLGDVAFSGPCFTGMSYPNGTPNVLDTVYTRGEVGQLLPDTACDGSNKITGRWFLVTGTTLPVVGNPYPTAQLRSVYRVDTDTAGGASANTSDSLYSYVFMPTSPGTAYPIYVHTVRIKPSATQTAPAMPVDWPGGAAVYSDDAGNTNGMGTDQADAFETGSQLVVDPLSGDGWLELPRLTRYGAWYIETGFPFGATTFNDSTATDTLVQYYDRIGRKTKPNRWTLPDSTHQNLLQKVDLSGLGGTLIVLYYVNESHFNANSNQGYIRKLSVTVTIGSPLAIANHTDLDYALESELGTDETFVYCANTSFTLPATADGFPAISGRWYRDLAGDGLDNADSVNATGVDGANLNTICRPVGIDTFFFVPNTPSFMSTKRVIGIAIPPQPVFQRSWVNKPDQVGTFWLQDTGCGEVSGAAWSVGASNTTAATRTNTIAPLLTTTYDLCEGTAFPLADSSDIHYDPTDPSNDVLNYAYPDTTFVGRWFHNSVPMPAVATGANAVTTADYYYRASRFVIDVDLNGTPEEVNVDSVRFRDNSLAQSCWNTLQVRFRIHPNHPEFANMQQTYCQGETPAALPTTSSNGVVGTWSPATINTATVGATTYTFTPDASQHPSCVSTHSVTIVVTRKSTPVFNDTTICVGSTLSLSTTSRDGIAGTWNTSGVNTSVVGTYTATFTPTVSGATAGNCYGTATITVRVAAAVAVSCPSSVNITLDPESCTKSLTFDALQMNGCADATHKIIVQDNNPLNGAVIDCPGTWTYGIFTKADNQLICWGTVNAEDKSGPLLVGFYQGATLNGAGGACRSYVAYTGAWHSAPWTTPPTSTVGNASQRFGVIDGDGATAGQQPVSQWTSELMCTDVNRVLNTAASWDGRTANYAYYTGRPDFADGCNKASGGPDFGSPTVGNLTNGSCACTDTLKANDQIVYYPCSAAGANNDILDGFWATITRTFTSTDCRGNVSTVSQTINFRRPAIADFASPAEQDGIFEGDTRQMPAVVVLDSTGCNNFDKAEMVRRLKAGQYYNTAALQEDRLVNDLQPKYIFDDLYSCDANERYSYFAEAVGTANYNNLMSFTNHNWGATAAAAGTVSKRLECNYSFDIEEVTQFPVCNGGMKLQVEVTAFDWCTGKRNVMDNILLKWTDAVKPSIIPSAAADRANNTTGAPGADNVHDKPVIISTGALDCTASFGIDIASLESFFGIDVSDNCTPDNLIDLNVQVQSCVYPTTSGIVTGAQEFRTVQYRTMVANGRNMVMGVPVGQHRLTITAFDKCYNQWTRSFDFTVLDRTAPIMKCTDQLTVTIANSSTSGPTNQFGGYGQTHPLTGYAVKGYAKVNVSEINRGSTDNCGMDWVRVRREIDPTDASDVAFFVAAGYDSNGDGTISTADGMDWNSDGDINDLMEKFETNNTGQMMTPALDFVEFHCGDLVDAGGVMIELWGRDKETNILTCTGNNLPTTPVTSGGNTNFCWMNVVVEDKVAPTFTRPSDARITCYNREALDTLRKAASVSGGIDITSSTYKWIETNIFVPQGDGRFIVNSGDDCNALTVKAAVSVVGINNCDSSGNVTITYSATKPNVQLGNATSTTVNVPVVNQRGETQATATIRVRRVHEYNLRFPADVSVLCTSGQITTRDTSNVADGGELGCDILSVNVTDKRYNGAVNASGTPVADCYRIYRTYTVVNWCQYDDRCGEPMQWAVIVPRDPDANNGNYNSTSATNPTGSTVANSGVNVLVRDLNANASESTTAATRIYFEDGTVTTTRTGATLPSDSPQRRSRNLTPEDHELVFSDNTVANYDANRTNDRAVFTYNNSQNVGCSSVDASKRQFAWMYTQYLYVTDRTAPEATINAATGTSIRKDNCLAPVSITFTATDACAGATGTESQNNTTANPSIAIERVRLRTYTSAYQGSASPSPVNSFQTNEQVSTIADVPGTQVSPSQALNLGTKNGGSWTYSNNLARGWYGLIVVVRDDCGNLSTQKELTFRVVDDQPTSPICYNGLSTDLMTTPAGGRMEVWASDFIAERKVYDCTGTGVAEPSNANLKQLEKYWVVKDDNGDGNFDAADGLAAATNAQGLAIFVPTGAANNSVIFDCDDLGDVAVRLYTRDEAGNWAWCETFAKITDARGVCPSGPGTQSAAVAGAIATESNLNVEGVEVSLSGDATMSYATNVNGQYNFAGLKKGYDYTVTPQLDKNYLNGVSTFDLVLITKHILGVQPLNSPYKLIAADVNNSKSVTTLDLIQLRKLILNIDTKFANNTSWRFVDSSFKFTNAANPWATQFPEVANLNDVAADVRANFVAVKIGDVNGNAVASSQVRTNGTFGLNVAEQALKAGNEYTVVFSGDLSQVEGYQFTLALDGNAVELVNLEAGIAKEENFGIFATEGVVTASWNGEAGNGNLFTLVVRAKADANLSEVLNLNSRYTAAEAYNKAGEQLNVALNFTGGQPVATGFELKQNTPNPFAGETVVGFNLPVAGDATLTIQDVTGRTLRVIKGAYAQGYNQVILKSNDLKATGVLYYTLESGEFTATRKMVILE